ncbi:MAG TPA: TonB-dependent receptor, partial [Bryobacteraceae bacterium]|nr:TonB-dependent receptor [Bryobacteraceae bacterium]
VRNRSFFHFSTEHIRLRQPVTFLSVVPSLGARSTASVPTRAIVNAFPLPNGAELSPVAAFHTGQAVTPSAVDSSALRLDHTMGTAGTVFVRYNRAPSSTESGYYSRNSARFASHSFTAGGATTVGPRVTLDARLGFFRNQVSSEWLPGSADFDLRRLPPPSGAGQALYGIGIRGVGQLVTGDAGRSAQTQWNMAATTSITHGRHDLRFGVDYLRLSPSRAAPITSVTSLFDSLDRLVFGAIPSYSFAQTGGGSSLIETVSLFAQDTWHITPRLNVTWGLRQEVTPPPSYRGPAGAGGEFVLSPNPVNSPVGVTATPAFYETPQWKTRAGQIAPRAGLAWRLGESWVLRAGAGLFYDLGFSSAVDLVNGAPYNRFRSMFAGIASVNTFEDSVQYGFAANLRLPRTAHWNVTVERMLGRDAAISAGYVAALGDGLLRREGYTDLRSGRPRLVLATNGGESSYHSLQFNYRSRDVRGLLGTIAYTWSHAIDNGSWDSASYLVFMGSSDRGSSNFDVRHNFQAALAYDLGRSGVRAARGWTLSGALRLRTGFPIDVITTDHPFGLGFDNDLRPDLVPGVPVWVDGRLNPAAFTRPAGFQGTLGRNAITGRSLTQLDLAVTRSFVITERLRLSLRAEAYNVPNHAQLADPVRVLASPMFGFSPSTTSLMLGTGRPNGGLSPAFQSGGPRTMQLGLTLRF